MHARPTRRRFIGISAAACGLALLPLGGFARAEAGAVRWRGRALGAEAELVLHHPDRAKAERLVKRAAAEIARLERIFSLYQPDSALSRLNRLGALATPPPELVALLETSHAAWTLTGGAFDPTVQPLWLLHARHFATPGADPAGPASGAVEAALEHVGFDRVAYGFDRVVFTRPGMGMTLNGIAQGFITDRVVELLREGGVTSALADAGEVRALGTRGDGSPWRAGIEAPGVTAPGAVLELADRALSTSSAAGFRFAGAGSPSHLLDPRSGVSASLHASVSVLAPDAAMADALSTAFSFMEAGRIAALAASLPGVEVHLFGHDGGYRRLG